jgi:hypothetical protein
VIERPTRLARLSRVNSSHIDSAFSGRPSDVASKMKSRAHKVPRGRRSLCDALRSLSRRLSPALRRASIPTSARARRRLRERRAASVEMIEQTYGHLAHDAEEWELDRLEAFDR